MIFRLQFILFVDKLLDLLSDGGGCGRMRVECYVNSILRDQVLREIP